MDDYRAYPNVTEAASMLGVSPATLSRRKPATVEFGGRDRRLAPMEVMRHAAHFKRRPLSAVASDLVRHTHRRAPDLVDSVDRQLGQILAARESKPVVGPEFLVEAQRILPRKLFLQVEKFYVQSDARPAEMGPSPLMPGADSEPTRKRRRLSVRALVGRAADTQKA